MWRMVGVYGTKVSRTREKVFGELLPENKFRYCNRIEDLCCVCTCFVRPSFIHLTQRCMGEFVGPL